MYCVTSPAAVQFKFKVGDRCFLANRTGPTTFGPSIPCTVVARVAMRTSNGYKAHFEVRREDTGATLTTPTTELSRKPTVTS